MEENKAPGPFSIGSQRWPGISKLIEEMGEVQQVCGKLIGTGGATAHWDGTDLRVRLLEELADLQAAIQFVQAKNFTADDDDKISKRVATKLMQFQEWDADQREKV